KGLFSLSCNILLPEAVPCDSLLLLCSSGFLVVVQWGEKLWGKSSWSSSDEAYCTMIEYIYIYIYII
ncbi:hypothetical protein MUK42_35949, partial [Musa troglodytarum]